MTDKVQKIREEVERLFNHVKDSTFESDSGAFYYLKDLLDFIDTLQEEPEPKTDWLQELQEKLNSLSKEDFKKVWAKYSKYGEEESVSDDLENAALEYGTHYDKNWSEVKDGYIAENEVEAFKAGAKWQKNHLLKPADGDDLPEIDRDVIALLNNGKVVFAHRPPEYWDGKDIDTDKVTRHYPKTYDKGGWNMPNVKYWLDVDLPKETEL